MKKVCLLILICVTVIQVYAQRQYSGVYYNHFGEEIELNPDSTFLHTWRFDLSSSWTQGSWRVVDDTVYFRIVPVYDTVRQENRRDSLVLSLDLLPEVISPEHYSLHGLFSGGQNIRKIPEKLFYSKDRLLHINNKGKLQKKKVKGTWTLKKHVPWFKKRKPSH
ncbi:hypothetical protein [Rufibacter roseus]|uniref:Uncharacterized protein n=1 Tax=Rufibacter roseus TaxID=1567108 RepID=A0ABW2DMK6_9BACT|nr:hypothetical protein [Rufibacter roseus]